MTSNNSAARYNAGKMNLKFALPLAAFVVLAIFLGVGLTLNPRLLPSTRIDQPAPAFSLNLLYAPEARFSPADYLGKRWMLNVWASWCVGCGVEHPFLNEIANKSNIILVGLNYKDNPQSAKDWLAERGNPYTLVATDVDGDVAIDWGVYAVPETFVIDENGVVIYKHIGPISAPLLTDEIFPLFAQNQKQNQK